MKQASWQFLFCAVLVAAFASTAATAATLDSEQAAFLKLVNDYRAQNGVGPLQVSATLQSASQWMSADMARKNYFSHTDSLGRNPFTRMAAFGYTYTPAGENLAAGYADAQNTFNQLRDACDPDGSGACTYAHRKNMLNANYKAIGIGRAYNASARYRWYWTNDFGGVVDKPLNTSTGNTTPNRTDATNSTTTPPICYKQLSAIPATCEGGTVTGDRILTNGCRSVTCQTSGSALQVLACNKPGNYQPAYFEMYKQTVAGPARLKLCIGKTCIADNGYAKSANYPICI